MLDLIVSTVTQGLIYGILACGLYITYKILDFPDLTVDGSFPLGAAVAALLMNRGWDPFLALLLAALAGAAAGLCTGFIHVRLKVRDLLAGIITMTGLYSVNLQLAGSNLPIPRSIGTVFSTPLLDFLDIPLGYKKLIVSLVLALLVKLALDFYLKTRHGMLLRAAGDNERFVTALGRDRGRVKILGLVLANFLVAFCGALVCQEQRAYSSTMGTGQMVFGLTAVIIGVTLLRRFPGAKGTTAALLGSVLYKACITAALQIGMPPNMLKLLMAALLLAILVAPRLLKGVRKHA